MIEIKAEVSREDDKIDMSVELDGIGAEIVAEALAIVDNLYDSLADNGIEDLFVLGAAKTVAGWIMNKKSKREDAEAGENLA